MSSLPRHLVEGGGALTVAQQMDGKAMATLCRHIHPFLANTSPTATRYSTPVGMTSGGKWGEEKPAKVAGGLLKKHLRLLSWRKE